MHLQGSHFKKIGLISATFIGVSSMIGSGWLFAPFIAAKIAGGSAIIAWVVTAFAMWLMFMLFSEIAGLFPKQGLTAVIPTISHNPYYAFPFAIANWLGITAVIAIEATASIEYLIQMIPEYKPIFYANEELTPFGSLAAVFIIAIYTVLNFWGVKLLAKANNAIVIFKLVVPLTTAALLFAASYHSQNFVATNGSFFANGSSGIINAILAGGLIFAFNGGQTVISYAKEIKNPAKTIPLSITIAISFALIVYLALQISFIGAMPPEMLSKGWAGINFNAPLVQLTALVGLHVMSMLLYVDAMVSPMGTAITYVGACTRMATAMAQKKQLPTYLDKINESIGMSRRSLIFNILISLVFLFSFHSWAHLAQILSLIHILSYLPIPIAIIIFRKYIPQDMYGFRLPFINVLALVLFVFFCYMFSMASFQIALEMVVVLLIFQAIFIAGEARGNIAKMVKSTKKSTPIFMFLLMMLCFNYFSPISNKDFESMFGDFAQEVFILILTICTSAAFYIFTKLDVNDDILKELVITRSEI